jgi:Meckel syndrome type 1 protein
MKQLNQRIRGRRGSRLAVSEYYELDQTRRLVLVKRDNMEHLILIGGPGDVVVESNIGGRGVSGDLPLDEARRAPLGTAGSIPMRQSPRPPVFGDVRPALRTVTRDEPTLNSPRDFEDQR